MSTEERHATPIFQDMPISSVLQDQTASFMREHHSKGFDILDDTDCSVQMDVSHGLACVIEHAVVAHASAAAASIARRSRRFCSAADIGRHNACGGNTVLRHDTEGLTMQVAHI